MYLTRIFKGNMVMASQYKKRAAALPQLPDIVL